MAKKVEVNEDDFKKIMLMLKYSKEFVKLDPSDLFLGNLWRVAPKLADKLVKKAGYVFVENKGRKTLKLESEVTPVNTEGTVTEDSKDTGANKPKDDKPTEATSPDPEPVEVVEEKPAEDLPSETEKVEEKKPRCRKRKRNNK